MLTLWSWVEYIWEHPIYFLSRGSLINCNSANWNLKVLEIFCSVFLQLAENLRSKFCIGFVQKFHFQGRAWSWCGSSRVYSPDSEVSPTQLLCLASSSLGSLLANQFLNPLGTSTPILGHAFSLGTAVPLHLGTGFEISQNLVRLMDAPAKLTYLSLSELLNYVILVSSSVKHSH